MGGCDGICARIVFVDVIVVAYKVVSSVCVMDLLIVNSGQASQAMGIGRDG